MNPIVVSRVVCYIMCLVDFIFFVFLLQNSFRITCVIINDKKLFMDMKKIVLSFLVFCAIGAMQPRNFLFQSI